MNPDMNVALQPAIFLDKDGTLIEDVPYNVDVKQIRVYPDVVDALSTLVARGYRLVVVSNQPGIAHGYFDDAAVRAAGEHLLRMLTNENIPVLGFYFCPHHPHGSISDYAIDCNCRKPKPGLLETAAREHHIDLERSWMVGDILNDVEAGRRAGCHTILLDRGNETEWLAGDHREPDWVVSSFNGVRRHITEQDAADSNNKRTVRMQ